MTGEWQPEATAPRDGRRLLLYVPPYGAMTGHFDHTNWAGGRWICHATLNKEAKPTHWMSLPAPPSAEVYAAAAQARKEAIREAAEVKPIPYAIYGNDRTDRYAKGYCAGVEAFTAAILDLLNNEDK